MIVNSPRALLRTQFGPVALGTDVFGVFTLDGTFCQPAGSCIPNEGTYCPAEND